MNRSLENLRLLLLQGPEQPVRLTNLSYPPEVCTVCMSVCVCVTLSKHCFSFQTTSQRRVEKAEILEHTVLFLQSSITEAKKLRAEDRSSSEGHQFLDGFSACLQKATRFLQKDSEAQGLHDSLSSSIFQCLSHPRRPSVRDVRRSHVTQGLQCVRRHAHTLSHPYRITLRHTVPNTVQNPHNHNTVNTSRSTTSPQTAEQCVWRPWP